MLIMVPKEIERQFGLVRLYPHKHLMDSGGYRYIEVVETGC